MATCSKCKKDIGFFSRTYTCLYCGRTLCKSCIKKLVSDDENLTIYELLGLPHADVICSPAPFFSTRKDVSCVSCYINFSSEITKIERALKCEDQVELLPVTYHGGRSIIGAGIKIKSSWHEDWTDCDNDLIAQAHYYGCDCVMKIEKIRDTETVQEQKDNGKGTYTRSYTIWQKVGLAYKLKK